MNLKKIFSNLNYQIKAKYTPNVIYNLNKLNSYQPYQLQYYQDQIKDQNSTTIKNLLQHYDQFISTTNDAQLLKKYSDSLIQFGSKFRKYLSEGKLNQITSLVSKGQQNIKNIVYSRNNNNKVRISENIMEIEIGGKNLNLELDQSVNQVQKPISQPILQKQLKPILPFLKSAKLITPQDVPSTIDLLAQYAKSQGKIAMGPVSTGPGLAYVGLDQVQNGKEVYWFPYPKNQIVSSKTPDIQTNFRYYANNTINSWNKFVDDEAKFVNFVNRVNTQQKRTIYMAEKVKALNVATFCAQQLSSLCYYYVQIPLQIFARKKIQSYDGTIESFMKHYQPGNNHSKNPFLLKKDQALKIFQSLFPPMDITPKDLMNLIMKVLQKFKNQINLSDYQKFNQYVTIQKSEAQQYFRNQGIPQGTMKQRLGNKNIVNLKKVKFILPSSYTNSQLLQIIQKVNRQQNTKSKSSQPTFWDQKWADQFIYAHDYVWKYEA